MKKFLKFFLATILVHGMGQCGSIAATKTTIKADIVEGIDTEYDFLKGAGHYEKNVLGTSAYKDSAGVEPVDGTGGSPTLTCTRTTSSPIDGAGSLLITHTASNLQGEGCSIPFTIENRDKNKVLSIKFSGRVASGTFVAGTPSADGDLTFYVYDVTNSALIRPSTTRIYSGSTTDTEDVISNFQTTSSTSYRLIVHNGTTNSSAWTYQVDNLKVSRSRYVYGTPVATEVDYGVISIASTGTSLVKGTTNVIDNIRGHRIANRWHFRARYSHDTAGTNGTGVYVISIPASAGCTIDTSVTGAYSGTDATAVNSVIGEVFARIGTTNAIWGKAYVYDSTRIAMMSSASTNPNSTYIIGGNTASGSSNWWGMNNASLGWRVEGSVPCVGWGSSVQMSSDSDTRVVAASGAVTVTANTGATKGTITANTDTHGAIASNEFTVPVPGFYSVALSLQGNAGGGAAYGEGHIYLNGSPVATSADGGDYTRSVAPNYGAMLKVGDKISFYANVSPAYGAWTGNFTISRSAGPGAIAATEKIVAKYVFASGVSSSSSLPLDAATKVYDSHNAVTTGSSWKFTAPANGVYNLSISAYFGALANLNIYKNGSKDTFLGSDDVSTASSGVGSVYLKQGEYIDVRTNESVSVNNASGSLPYSTMGIAIERVSAF